MDFEILMATVNRKDLDFLNPIFINNTIENLHILIINQTRKGNELFSEKETIRIINSYETGSPNSRNLAIENAQGKICLFADDDIIYHKNLKNKVLDAYNKNEEASIITFETVNGQNKKYMTYPSKKRHDKKSILRINNIGISFKRNDIRLNNILYNQHFGVGATFPGCTEYFFLKNALEKKLPMFHQKEVIVTHEHLSSGQLMGNDNAIKARTAQSYSRFGWLSIPWLLKYLYYMINLGYIERNQFKNKLSVGLNAIKTFRKLKKLGEV